MSFAILTLPAEGCTPEKKAALMAGVKAACAEGFGLPPQECFCWVHELLPENMGEGVRHLRSGVILTACGKPLKGKELISARFDALCKELFDDPLGRNILVFKEHRREDVGALGTIRALQD